MTVLKLPIWLQAVALASLVIGFLGTAGWVHWQVEHPLGGDPNSWNRFFRSVAYAYCLALPLPVVYLGVRLALQIARIDGWRHWIFVWLIAMPFSLLLLALVVCLTRAQQWARSG